MQQVIDCSVPPAQLMMYLVNFVSKQYREQEREQGPVTFYSSTVPGWPRISPDFKRIFKQGSRQDFHQMISLLNP